MLDKSLDAADISGCDSNDSSNDLCKPYCTDMNLTDAGDHDSSNCFNTRSVSSVTLSFLAIIHCIVFWCNSNVVTFLLVCSSTAMSNRFRRSSTAADNCENSCSTAVHKVAR